MSNSKISEFKERLANLDREKEAEISPLREAVKTCAAAYAEMRRDILKEMKAADGIEKSDIRGVKFAVKVERMVEVEQAADASACQLALELFPAWS